MKMFLFLMTIHFIADFVFQVQWMAVNKSKNIWALLSHVAVYSIMFTGFGFNMVWITFLAHFITDGITSQFTSYFWGAKKERLFFITIGFDQLLHCFQLVLTYQWLFGRLHA